MPEFKSFRVMVRPSAETNDHEVRFLADDTDVIEQYCPNMMGLDPGEILIPGKLSQWHDTTITIGRCKCGVVSCGSIAVQLTHHGSAIQWSLISDDSSEATILRFPADKYENEVTRALNDTSWETPDRKAARLAAEAIDRDRLRDNGFTYEWASGRVRAGYFTLSLILEPGPYQVLVHIPWSDTSPAEIARTCAELVATDPRAWPEVQWFPQRRGLESPRIAGAGWSTS